MKTIKEILLWIWQLPQHLVALIWILIATRVYGKPEVTDYKGRKYYWFPKWYCGVSLGHYVLLGEYARQRGDIINHEYGHSRQSVYLGPFYLLVIGLPSGIYNRIDACILSKKYPYKVCEKMYYSKPWEHWADILGGVERHFDD